jgi:shikimate kinase
MAPGSGDLLALAGMMGSGKSTVAAILARWLRRPLVSTDARVVARAGKPIAAIFAEDGEARFRALERDAVLALRGPLVVDLGGGAFCDPAAAAHLLAAGTVAFLDVSEAEAARRIGAGEGRPLAASWGALLARRLPLYRRATLAVRVDGRSPEAVARLVLDLAARPAARSEWEVAG